jgi:hypothetical protein
MRVIAPLLRGLAVAAIATTAGAAQAHDYPTSERVVYVEACMRDHPGGHYEMLNKCSCVLDAIAAALSYDDYVEMSTALNASTIGGEGGSVIRDAPLLQDQIKQFKAVQAKAQKSCFIQ